LHLSILRKSTLHFAIICSQNQFAEQSSTRLTTKEQNERIKNIKKETENIKSTSRFALKMAIGNYGYNQN
jgi:hypothetical protein